MVASYLTWVSSNALRCFLVVFCSAANALTLVSANRAISRI